MESDRAARSDQESARVGSVIALGKGMWEIPIRETDE